MKAAVEQERRVWGSGAVNTAVEQDRRVWGERRAARGSGDVDQRELLSTSA